jgi:hypothetical protein
LWSWRRSKNNCGRDWGCGAPRGNGLTPV